MQWMGGIYQEQEGWIESDYRELRSDGKGGNVNVLLVEVTGHS